jgi:hypothetical protein
MTNQHRNLKERNTSTDRAVLGLLAVATTTCDLTGAAAAQCCNLLNRISWAVFELLRLLLTPGHGLIPAAYFSDSSSLLQLLLHVGPCMCCVLHFLGGRA